MANIPRSPFYVPQSWEPAWGVFSSHARISLLLDPPIAPIVSSDISAQYPKEAPEWWQWKAPPNRMLLATAVAVTNPFFSRAWHYDYNDSSNWNQGPQNSAVLHPLLTVGGQPPTKRWQPYYNYDVAESAWMPTAPKSAVLLSLLTNIRMYGAGGQAPTKQWHYDYDEERLELAVFARRDLAIAARITLVAANPFLQQRLALRLRRRLLLEREARVKRTPGSASYGGRKTAAKALAGRLSVRRCFALVLGCPDKRSAFPGARSHQASAETVEN